MIKQWFGDRLKTNTVIEFICDNCGAIFKRPNKVFRKLRERPIYENRDLCNPCCRKIINNTDTYKNRMSEIVLQRYKEHPEIIEKIIKSTKGKINLGELNGMKQEQSKKKVSIARKKMFSEPLTRKCYSEKTKNAWRQGKFNGVRVGQCEWLTYKHTDGHLYKVQGTWELAFIEWLDKNKLEFKCHRGRLAYTINGEAHSYYPDFWINQWDAYVDVKARCFYAPAKFEAIRACNPDTVLHVLFKEDLLKLGVKI